MNLKKKFKTYTKEIAKSMGDLLKTLVSPSPSLANFDLGQNRATSFMIKAGQTVRKIPQFIPKEEAELTVSLIIEEAFELAKASNVSIFFEKDGEAEPIEILEGGLTFEASSSEQDLVEVGDALTDLDFVVSGGFSRYGISAEPLKKEIFRSNMTKFIDGYRREDGKWVKGKSYSPANIKALIKKQQKE